MCVYIYIYTYARLCRFDIHTCVHAMDLWRQINRGNLDRSPPDTGDPCRFSQEPCVGGVDSEPYGTCNLCDFLGDSAVQEVAHQFLVAPECPWNVRVLRGQNHWEAWLVGEHGFYFSIYWECHHPNRRTPSFFRGVRLKPPTSWGWSSWTPMMAQSSRRMDAVHARVILQAAMIIISCAETVQNYDQPWWRIVHDWYPSISNRNMEKIRTIKSFLFIVVPDVPTGLWGWAKRRRPCVGEHVHTNHPVLGETFLFDHIKLKTTYHFDTWTTISTACADLYIGCSLNYLMVEGHHVFIVPWPITPFLESPRKRTQHHREAGLP